ncbi:DUF3239 domain-containing protein [Corynebacterium felinum]|uniref:DUF3239 domain-containing protein n=1 Tax=Corynebacterium felinum TaxID=131318 RepID=A0ABU2B8P4_9CORY|nr:DUF3239 domain-containing protein [Corynebacterium felinum]MDF5820296.1 DUF3239 domain-containing protein [Corynebacterium felinum]MDR7354997.1 hypothetical protein [Corynebacterium felinum]WJY94351.1 hypothetical protein CFELI_03585 [Corynebacterium felinum]
MKNFNFSVDNEHAKKNNELLKDTKRLQISAALFGFILLGVGYGLSHVYPGTLGTIIIGTFAVMAVVSFALIFVIPRQVGTADKLYATYELCPAVIAEVNPRDMVLLALVNINANREGEPRWGLATRTITRLEGHNRKKGERVPSVAVTGRRSVKSQEVWDEISPMPIAWGTTDATVIKEATKTIPFEQWNLLEKNVSKLDQVKATRFNLLPL